MRGSVSNIAKLFIADDRHDDFDRAVVLRAQKACKARGALLRYMRGQVCLADWYEWQLEDMAQPDHIICFDPNELQKLLSAIGYVWSESQRLWRLRDGRKRPRSLNEIRKLKNPPERFGK